MYTTTFPVTTLHVDRFDRCKPSALLRFAQDAAGEHCNLLGTDWDSMSAKNYFWAVIRQKMEITRLPKSGETVTVKTWPMPTTRVAYPRSVVAYDEEGKECFRSISLWVLMDLDTRSMILPGKSGIDVNGILRGNELASPLGLVAKGLANSRSRGVCFTDLDRNGHMNNTRYLEWVDDLLPSAFHRSHTIREFTVCYLSEAREGDRLDLQWDLPEENLLLVDGHREQDGQNQRVFSARFLYE